MQNNGRTLQKARGEPRRAAKIQQVKKRLAPLNEKTFRRCRLGSTEQFQLPNKQRKKGESTGEGRVVAK